MDTTEQLNGTYFFDGMSVDKEELLYWLLLDEFKKQFSDVIDLLAIASMLVSSPVIPVSGKLGAVLQPEEQARFLLGSVRLSDSVLSRAVEPSPGQNSYVASGHKQPV